MPTEQITIGPVFSMVQNTIYAMPASVVTLFATGTPTIVASDTVGMAATVSVTLTNGQATVAAGFVKLTSAGPVNVFLKKA